MEAQDTQNLIDHELLNSKEMISLKDNQIKKELKELLWLREFRRKSLSKSCLIRVGNLLMITSPRSGKISRSKDLNYLMSRMNSN